MKVDDGGTEDQEEGERKRRMGGRDRLCIITNEWINK